MARPKSNGLSGLTHKDIAGLTVQVVFQELTARGESLPLDLMAAVITAVDQKLKNLSNTTNTNQPQPETDS